MFLDFAHAHLREDVVVDSGDLLALALVVGQVINVDFRRILHGNLVGVEFAFRQLETVHVVVAVGNLTELLGFAVAGEDLVGAAVIDHAEDLIVVVGPADAGEVVVEILRHISAFAGGEVHHHQADQVALVAVALHALPSDVLAVVAEHRVLVVTHDALTEVLGRFLLDIIKEDVAVGGVRIVVAGLLAAGVGDFLAVGTVVVLLDAAPRTHRAFESAVDEAGGVFHIHLVTKFGEENLRVLIHPVIPVAVHEVLVDAAGGLVETGVQLVEVARAHDGFGGDEDDGLAIGGEFEALESALVGGDFLLLAVLDGHGDDVVVAAEEQRFVVFPHEVELGRGGGGEARHVLAGGGHEVDFGVTLVLFYVVVGHGVGDLGAVGGDGHLAHLAQRPHHLRGETAVLDLDFGFPDDVRIGLFLFRCTGANQRQ